MYLLLLQQDTTDWKHKTKTQKFLTIFKTRKFKLQWYIWFSLQPPRCRLAVASSIKDNYYFLPHIEERRGTTNDVFAPAILYIYSGIYPLMNATSKHCFLGT